MIYLKVQSGIKKWPILNPPSLCSPLASGLTTTTLPKWRSFILRYFQIHGSRPLDSTMQPMNIFQDRRSETSWSSNSLLWVCHFPHWMADHISISILRYHFSWARTIKMRSQRYGRRSQSEESLSCHLGYIHGVSGTDGSRTSTESHGNYFLLKK